MEDMRLKPCPFCGEDKARLVYINEESETVCVDSDEELNASDILAFIHCYGCENVNNCRKDGAENEVD